MGEGQVLTVDMLKSNCGYVGVWSIEYGVQIGAVWNMEYGIWSTDRGSMEYGIWNMEYR
jgi:hypothetical protein